ncbi:DUF5361 domain-containing protein [Actinobaculum sp. 352]|uniref:DUF5361 domain-containing protein n=1 Tax=Actinobaculum sp. 352 TaxID=2490946 RepID=UPI000F7F2C7B|nr:DUF5361 domain-containing protein [Actinobaculum sp. 352]RTE50388.1 hypothetical protein EKN07_04110 [Actinobaculum sp. 352]
MIVRQSPQDSALHRAMHGEDALWDMDAQLLAHIADHVAWLVWAKTADGQKGRNRPKPIPRPGVEPAQGGERHIGTAAPVDVILSMC